MDGLLDAGGSQMETIPPCVCSSIPTEELACLFLSPDVVGDRSWVQTKFL